jgi:DNA-binding transcriptional ArsR family regulator
MRFRRCGTREELTPAGIARIMGVPEGMVEVRHVRPSGSTIADAIGSGLTVYTAFKDPALVRALSHPLRTQILTELHENRASPSELSEKLDAPLANVAYHVRILLDLKLIRLVKKTQRRGAIEHHYEAISGYTVDDGAWGETPAIVKNKMVSSALADVGRSVTDAAVMGGFDRDDAHLTRTRLVLDEKGWSELADLLHDVLAQADRIQTDSRERLRANDHADELRSALVMMLLEAQPSVPDASHAAAARKTGASRSKAGKRTRAKTH